MKTKFIVFSSALALMSCSVFADANNSFENFKTNVSDTIPTDTLPKKDTTTKTDTTATIIKAKPILKNNASQAFNMKAELVVAAFPAKEESTSEK